MYGLPSTPPANVSHQLRRVFFPAALFSASMRSISATDAPLRGADALYRGRSCDAPAPSAVIAIGLRIVRNDLVSDATGNEKWIAGKATVLEAEANLSHPEIEGRTTASVP